MVVNYQNSKIYKLWSDQSDCFYIGSTTQSLAMRLGGHIRDIRRKKTKTQEKMQEHTNIKIELIETFPCNSREELVAREGFYIRLHREQLLNKSVAGRTKQEYYEVNCDAIRARERAKYAENRDAIRAKYAEKKLSKNDSLETID